MKIVRNVPFRRHPIITWVFRIFTLVFVGAIIFTITSFVRYQRTPHKAGPPTERLHPIVVPYK
jgi:hypothetical protein